MQELVHGHLRGKWRSYQSFFPSGEVKKHSPTHYCEFDFKENGELEITVMEDGIAKHVHTTTDWTLEFRTKRYFLTIKSKKLEYEVISINHAAFVLMETKGYEKFFCARPNAWESYVTATGISM